MLRHPRRVLAVFGLAFFLLAAFGLSLEGKLSPSTLDIPGTSTSRASQLLRDHFGDNATFPILLRGPAAAIDRQGPELVRVLRREYPQVTTLSPWDRGSVGRLRPGPRRALIIADFHVSVAEAVKETVPELNRTLGETISPPVVATQTGFATISREIQDESIKAAERGELIALPILLIVLLLVFRSPVAAAIPLGFGALTVFASRGLLAILTEWFTVDALSLVVCTMMGLALGVDYALLMVSRFREELAGGANTLEAAAATRGTAGRTTVFAGSTLMLSMLVAMFVVPGALLASLAATVAMVVGLSVLVAVVAGPALLTLLGPNVDRWQIGSQANGRSRLMTIVHAALRRPAPVAALIGGVVLFLAAPALALRTGPLSPGQLPPDDPVRQDYEEVVDAIGPGYDAPFVIVAATDEGAITDSERLDALDRWQRRIADYPGVLAVVGPGQVSRAVAPLRRFGNGILASGEGGPLAGVGRLGRVLGRITGGVALLRNGLSRAAAGAGLLDDGTGQAEDGAVLLAQGLSDAGEGIGRTVAAVDRFADVTRQLAVAERRAALGGLVLKLGIRDLIPNLRHNALLRSRNLQRSLNQDAHSKLPQLIAPAQEADAQIRAALQQLDAMTVGKTDPNYDAALSAVRQAAAAISGTNPATGQPYAEGYAGLPAELTALQERLLDDAEQTEQITSWLVTAISSLNRLLSTATQLSDGLNQIESAGRRLADGAARFASASADLNDQLLRAATAATALAGGIAQLGDGTSALQENLALAYTRSYPLQAGLRRATVRIVSTGDNLTRQTDRVRRSTPGLFNSGYFVLSALDGASPSLRERATGAIDLDRGGQAATLLVISRYTFNTPGSISINKRLESDAAALGREANVETGVAGGPATLNTYSRVARDRFPLVIAAITLATFLVLVLVLRALPLAAIAVGLNLATVGVAFGILTLLGYVPQGWPLGGREYVDAVGATMIFGVVFGLSIDYAVFLLVRMREHFDRHGDGAAAIEFGLEKTARVITGAAAIMMAVFVAFAGAPIATVSQLGVGLTIAVLLDATIVRIVLLPALMLLVGDRVWWLPRSLDRVMPKLNV
jgi:putative drug exporter of the RND superfamily